MISGPRTAFANLISTWCKPRATSLCGAVNSSARAPFPSNGCVHEFWPTCADEYWPTLRGLICYAGPAGGIADQRRFSVSPFMSCWPCAVP
jgi:hypothetical protein